MINLYLYNTFDGNTTKKTVKKIARAHYGNLKLCQKKNKTDEVKFDIKKRIKI